LVQKMRALIEWMLCSFTPPVNVEPDSSRAEEPRRSRSKGWERRILQSYVWVLRAPQDVDGQKSCSLVRYGAYEVRLIEPSQMLGGNSAPFWIELYDHNRKLTIDCFGNDDLEQAAETAVDLIAEAKRLELESARRQ
jgi:hypothetical protein